MEVHRAVPGSLHLELGRRGFGDRGDGFHGRGATHHSAAWQLAELTIQCRAGSAHIIVRSGGAREGHPMVTGRCVGRRRVPV